MTTEATQSAGWVLRTLATPIQVLCAFQTGIWLFVLEPPPNKRYFQNRRNPKILYEEVKILATAWWLTKKPK